MDITSAKPVQPNFLFSSPEPQHTKSGRENKPAAENQGPQVQTQKAGEHQDQASLLHEVEEALEQLEKTAHAFSRRFHFKLHEKAHEYFVQIINIETNEVINEVPPEKVLNLVAQIKELVGLILNKRV